MCYLHTRKYRHITFAESLLGSTMTSTSSFLQQLLVPLFYVMLMNLYSIHAEAERLNRFDRLSGQSEKFSIVELSSETLSLHISSKHNYSMIVLFTTEGQASVQCPLCQTIGKEYTEVALTFRDSLGKEKYRSAKFLQTPLFFIKCDINRCLELFQKIGGLSIPYIVYVPPRTFDVKSINSSLVYPMNNIGEEPTAKGIANFVKEKTNILINIAISPTNLFGILGVLLTVVYIITHIQVKKAFNNFYRANGWFWLSMVIYFFVMSGSVFNAIHQPPWFYKNPQTQQIMFIYPSARQQFVVEGFLMASILIGLGLAVIGFTVLIPKFSDLWKQRSAAIFLISIFYFLYQSLLIIFRSKYPWYPF